MILHIPEFKAMAKCNQHLDHDAFDIEIDDDLLVKHGRWEMSVESKCDTHTGEYWEEEYYNCLKCDYTSDWKSPYCPNCGCKMDLEG